MSDFKQREKNALDHRKLNLTQEMPGLGNASLIWGVHSNAPRLTVYYNKSIGENREYDRISANLDTPTFFAFVRLLEQVAKSDKPIELYIANQNYEWIDNVRAEHPSIVSKLWVGKEEDGQIWVGVFSERHPKIRFFINNGDWHTLFHGDGTPFTAGDSSQLYALGYCDLLRNMVSNILVDEFVDMSPQKPQN